MMRLVAGALCCWCIAATAQPVGLKASLPEVHSVELSDTYVTVRSAGVSLRYLGPLQMRPVPSETIREFAFRIPRHPQPASGRRQRVPSDVIGAFVNGLPIYNQFEALSYNGANLWHYDAIARNAPTPPGLIEELIPSRGAHSPRIGFALDGYPVYGPWTANADGTGGLRRMRSSYRLRAITQRHDWPDGTRLTPEQYGPDVSATDPLGTFAEDYEFAAGSGDLDKCNGRFTRTPEYPDGTYAYFLATDTDGRLAYPYLIGPRFHGRVPDAAPDRFVKIGKRRLELQASELPLKAGAPTRFRLVASDEHGEPIQHFEYVHERPIHLLIASQDLAEFDHIHPELAADGSYEVAHTFQHGGIYRLWADYSLPGEPPHVDEFEVHVAGPLRTPERLIESSSSTRTAGTLSVTLALSKPLRAGEDIPITLKLAGSLDSLQPYLGAWAHVIVISQDLRSFSHAHPIDAAPVAIHTHDFAAPPPRDIHIVTNFASAGLYKMWAQFQLAGQVLTVPFVVAVGPAVTHAATPAVRVPADALRIRVTRQGYVPASFEVPANRPMTLAFTRDSEPNCGSEILFPALGIRAALPIGETVLVRLPALAAREISFSCGMGMFRGMIVAR